MQHDEHLVDTGSPLSRRGFLRTGLSAAAVAAALPAASADVGAILLTPAAADIHSGELDEMGISELASGLKSGNYTCRSLVEKYLQRMEAIDTQGPAIRSVIEVNPDALAIADALDREMKEKGPRSPLHGIPILIKDNIDTADRMMTTAGSLALVGAKPPDDAFLVQQLRRAGAILLGKTNLSEWANIRSNHSTSGWSGRGGLTKNPYALDRNTSGSSSGSAAAVAANLCAVAVGTETDGSIVSPSSVNGVVGIKPTVGLVSRTGVIPISHSQDTPGPMARTVRDAALLLGALTGIDPADAASRGSRGKVADYVKDLAPGALKGARIGVVRKYFGFLPAVDEIMKTALDTLRAQGAVLIDPAEITTLGEFDDSESLVLRYELKADLNAYLARLGPDAPVRTLKDIIEYNERNADTEMPYFGQETFLKAEAKGPLTSREYLNALKKIQRLARVQGIDSVMNKHALDALVAPTDGPGWVTDLITGDHYIGGSSTAAAVAGYPSITVPAGFIFGMPVGISFFGRQWGEAGLIRLAYAFEQATKIRRPPRFLPTAAVKA
jgi:amidase